MIHTVTDVVEAGLGVSVVAGEEDGVVHVAELVGIGGPVRDVVVVVGGSVQDRELSVGVVDVSFDDAPRVPLPGMPLTTAVTLIPGRR